MVAGANTRPGAGRSCGAAEDSEDWQVVGVERFFMREDYNKVTHVNDIAVLR